ncbi:MAG TPA: ATP-binding protein [Terriglobales bacterium]|nr:ATP-binding protein [Terriglobales bacterium]
MSINLYAADLNSLGGTELYAAIETLLRLSDPPSDRLSEGWTLDYKEQWSDEMLKHAAAFANTFGGLLIVGVSEKDGKPQEIIGVQLRSELKTQIASSIAANISPTPQFEIAECLHPDDPKRRVAVVRMRNVNKLHYYMKGDKPIYVRNEDESRPANAAQLRSLIEQRTRESVPVNTGQMLKDLSSRFYVTSAKQAGTYEERKANRVRSSTYLMVFLRPTETLSFPFDASTEDLFDAVIARSFPEIARRWNDEQAERQESRGSDWHGIEFWQRDLDFEMNWLFSPREVALVTQVNVPITGVGNSWSLADVALNLAFHLRAANAIWEALDFYGEARIACQLKVEGLKLYRGTAGFYSIFYNSELFLVPAIIKGGSLTASIASGEVGATFISRTADLSVTVSAITNQLLRGLGFSADLETLRAEVKRLLRLADMRYAYDDTQ